MIVTRKYRLRGVVLFTGFVDTPNVVSVMLATPRNPGLLQTGRLSRFWKVMWTVMLDLPTNSVVLLSEASNSHTGMPRSVMS